MSALADGIYDIYVVEAETDHHGVTHIDVVVLSGDAKGAVVTVDREAAEQDAADLLGRHGVLVMVEATADLRLA